MSPRTVLFVIGSMRLGGAEKQLALLADQLVRQGWSVEIFSLEGGDGVRDAVVTPTVRVHWGGWNSTWPRWRKVLSLFRAQWRLCRLAVQLKADVVHAVLPLTNFMGAIAGRLTGRPLVITSRRALGTHQDKNRAWCVTDRTANRLSDYIVANSKAVAADTVARNGIDASKLRVIHNGIDVALFERSSKRRDELRAEFGIAPQAIVVGCLSNLIAYKGHKELVAAFADVMHAKDPGSEALVLLLAGEDRGRGDSLRRQVNELRIADRVRFLGPREDVPDVLAAVDIGVLPSHEEGFSNALLEMLAAGLPVVATDVGGNREALEGMHGCYLVPKADPAALADALRRLIRELSEQPQQRAARIDAIRQRFPVSAMVDRYVELYRARR
jgi:glycosyltransferase involved in cell wall biosynthesis